MIFNWFKGNKDKPASPDTNADREGGAAPPSGLQGQQDGLVENAVALSTGLEMVDAYYPPGHDPIDYYGDGGFRFGSMSHKGALMFLPSGIRRWDVVDMDDVSTDNFSKVLQEKDDIEIVLIGTGERMCFLDRSLLMPFVLRTSRST